MQCKWVFRTKIAVNGYDVKYKAILVSKGFSQFQEVEYTDTFAPVAKMDSIRLVLAIATSKRWEVYHMDVKISFLHGEIHEYTYMHQFKVFQEYPSLFFYT